MTRTPGARTPAVAEGHTETEMTELSKRYVGFKLARFAHWAVNDRGYTKRMIATELREIARQMLPPDIYAQSIGDAGKL